MTLTNSAASDRRQRIGNPQIDSRATERELSDQWDKTAAYTEYLS